MSSKHEDADLILKLYDLRREPVMRQARAWLAGGFFPTSADDIVAAVRGEHSAYFRMVLSYWEMACALVNNGALDAHLFQETNGEHIFIFAKLEPFLPELRQRMGARTGAQIEKCIRAMPDAEVRLQAARDSIARVRSAHVAGAKA